MLQVEAADRSTVSRCALPPTAPKHVQAEEAWGIKSAGFNVFRQRN